MGAAPKLYPPMWVRHPNYLTCQREHLYRHYEEENGAADYSRMAGYLFKRCKDCGTFALFIFSTSPAPTAYGYALTQEQYDYWRQQDYDADSMPPAELLYRLGYNPSYQPVRRA